MRNQTLPKDYQHISPAGAEVRILMNNTSTGVAHCTLRNGTTSKAISHKTVSEIWHVISGQGEIWRKSNDNESIISLTAGTTIDIPLGTHFQYRSILGQDLVFLCITTPLWPGPDEVNFLENGAWAEKHN